jgi:dCMP deaminase
MKQKFADYYMKIAEATAELSTAVRLKVGSIIVKNNSIISYGYNGTPTGWDNTCEYREYLSYGHSFGENAADYFDQRDEHGKMYRLVTKPEVLHAEANAILKVARSTESSDGATLFCTHAPCLDCAKLIHQAGINSVYYRNAYRSTDGITFLEKSGITIQQF